MIPSSCSHCNNTGESTCFYCGCTVCGTGVKPFCPGSTGANIIHSGNVSSNSSGETTLTVVGATTICCVTCHSHTHAGCARDPFTGAPFASVSSSPGESCFRRNNNDISCYDDSTGSTYNNNSFSTILQSPVAVRQIPSAPFFCSVDCAFGVSIVSNTQWSSSISHWVEERASLLWESAVASAKATLSSSCYPSEVKDMGSFWVSYSAEILNDETKESTTHPVVHYSASDAEKSEVPKSIDSRTSSSLSSFSASSSFLQMRFEAWKSYFSHELLYHAHSPLPSLVPFWLNFHSEAVLLHLQALFSPTGQARRLCTLDPNTHPVGSCLALPDPKRWQEWSTPIKRGETNSFVWESKERIQQMACSPSKVIEKRLLKSMLSPASLSPKRKVSAQEGQPEVSLTSTEQNGLLKHGAVHMGDEGNAKKEAKINVSNEKRFRSDVQVSGQSVGGAVRIGKKEMKEG